MALSTEVQVVDHIICGNDRFNGIKLSNKKCTFEEQDILICVSGYSAKVRRHIEILRTISGKLGYFFKRHDKSKLYDRDILVPLAVCDYYRRNKQEMPKEWQEELKKALKLHYDKEQHHPEHYINILGNPEAVNKMNDIDIIEMCCDWAAMAQEFDSKAGKIPDARNFARENIMPNSKYPEFTGKRWKFDEARCLFIMNTLDKIYD